MQITVLHACKYHAHIHTYAKTQLLCDPQILHCMQHRGLAGGHEGVVGANLREGRGGEDV